MTTLTPVATRSQATPLTSSAIKSILRKPSTVLGRRPREEDGESSDGLPGSSPAKKRKTVMFNDKLNMIKEFGGKTLDDAKREVKQALEGHARGDDEDYDGLKEIFCPSPKRTIVEEEDADTPQPQDLQVYVVALTSHVPLLDRSCSGLIRAVLSCTWLDRDDVFARAYIQLLAALSAKVSFRQQVLSMMVEKFTETRSSTVEVVPGFPPVDSETKKERLHLGLKYLLELYADARPMILDIVTHNFPHTEESKTRHMEYIDHLLRLKADKPDLERDIMELILSRLVKLDVEMTLDLENDDDETTRAVLRQLEASNAKSDDEDDDAMSEADSDDEDEEESDEQTRRILLLKSKLETMDAILDLMFSIYDPVFADPDSPEALATFEDLLTDFVNVILPHLKSRHTQYLLFKFAMKSNRLMEMFIGTLFNIAFQSTRAPVVKQAAVAYLASFTARGARVQSDQVQLIAQTFLDYIDHYRNTHTSCRGPDIRRYSQYYAYFQGLLYIFCFRWRDLIDRDEIPATFDWDDPASFLGQDLPWMKGLRQRLQVNIASKLNPLKCCSPIIVDEFARLSHHLRLIYIYPQIEKNKTIHLSQFFTSSYATGGALRDSGFEFDHENWTHIEACFPFDPFQLPVAKRWLDLDKNYVEWRSIAVLEKGGDADSDEDSDDEDDDVSEDGMGEIGDASDYESDEDVHVGEGDDEDGDDSTDGEEEEGIHGSFRRT
ncbi:hypothetical protein SMACR_04861 [Sordaria macrospora]|nr:hypothetical protein SMACR_04861 [Sordaria macrospora]WPJ59436.1 hypothetical protein SMAC4_04861 [Sordaria macrospora]